MPRPRVPRLHVVTDDGVLARASFPTVARAVADAGGEGLALHVRGPTTSGAVLHRLTEALLEHAVPGGALILVNDRVDVALTAAAHGAHLGARSMTVADARALLPENSLLGRSTHEPAEVAEAARDGADYAFVGTIFETPSHPGRSGGGVQALERTVAVAKGMPVLGIGGIRPRHVAELMGAGAHGVAVVRGVWDARSPESAVAEYLQELEREAA